jgi:hypothetical protein
MHDYPDSAQARLQNIWSTVEGNGNAADKALRFMLEAFRAETERLSMLADEADEVAAVRAATNAVLLARAATKAAVMVDLPPPP